MTYDDDTLRIHIRRLGEEHGSVAEWAKTIRVHPEQVYQFLRGNRSAEPKLLEAMGLQRVITYSPKSRGETSSAQLGI
jgi:hypothetical protein